MGVERTPPRDDGKPGPECTPPVTSKSAVGSHNLRPPSVNNNNSPNSAGTLLRAAQLNVPNVSDSGTTTTKNFYNEWKAEVKARKELEILVKDLRSQMESLKLNYCKLQASVCTDQPSAAPLQPAPVQTFDTDEDELQRELEWQSVPGKRRRKNSIKAPLSNEGPVAARNLSVPGTERPPPIVVPAIRRPDVARLIQGSKLPVDMSFSSTGVKLLPKSLDDHSQILLNLSEVKKNHFTYRTKEERTSKFVLYGLDLLPIEEIMKELGSLNLKPASVKLMTIKNKKYEDQCNYLVAFPSLSKVTLLEVRRVRSLLHTIVRWERYTNYSDGPVQCRTCQRYGHGAEKCFMDPRCIKCAGSHLSSRCPLSIGGAKLSIESLKCVNCEGNHTANAKICPMRPKDVGASNNIPTDEQTKKITPSVKPVIVNRTPGLKSDNNKKFSSLFKDTQPKSGATMQDGHELLSAGECWRIFTDFSSQLARCRSKHEQIAVIAQFSFSHLT